MRVGVLAGIFGIGAIALADLFERAWLGHRPPYAPERIAARLFDLRSRRRARALGAVLRWSYGLTIAAAWDHLVPRATHGSVRRAIGLGMAILAFERVALPALGATPPLRRWSRAERALLAVHTQAFGFGEELARRLVSV